MSILILSPLFINNGTVIIAPVSTLAGLLAPVAESPLTPGSVSTTSSSTKFGALTWNALPAWNLIIALSFSLKYKSAS